jgi:hypothetical protein
MPNVTKHQHHVNTYINTMMAASEASDVVMFIHTKPVEDFATGRRVF